MEGYLLAVHVPASGGEKPWQTDFVKYDDISAQLLGFTDRSQAELKWKLHLKDADVATPAPGNPKHNHAPNVDETPHCFYAHEVTSCGTEVLVFIAAPDDEMKNEWMTCLQQAAKDGPHPPRFSDALSPRAVASASLPPYCFEARVTQVRLHSDGKHAEYMVTCHVSVFSRAVNRRLTKEWNVWHRFSEFDALNEALKTSLGADKMADVPFFKTHRDAIRSLFGWWSLDQDFLDHRRLLLDTLMCRLCAIDGVASFFQDDSSEHLKKFLAFDEHCEEVDPTPRQTPPQEGRGLNPRTSDMSPRDSDHASASFSSAVMSPVTVPPVATYSESVHDTGEFETECEQHPTSPESTNANTKPTEPPAKQPTESPPRNPRKKNKGKNVSPVVTESSPVAVVANETEVVRLPTHAGGKKGRKKN